MRQRRATLIRGNGARYVGKRLLVGITYETEDGEFLTREQFHGVIVAADKSGVIVERSDTNERVSLPPQLEKAQPGEYRLKSTGELVVDPDFVATWRLTKPVADPDLAGDSGGGTGG